MRTVRVLETIFRYVGRSGGERSYSTTLWITHRTPRSGRPNLPHDQAVHFVHFSVQEFLLRVTVISSPGIETICLSQTAVENDLLCQVCLRFMSYDDLIEEKRSTSEFVQGRINDCRFLECAARFCIFTLNKARNGQTGTLTLPISFLTPTDGFFGVPSFGQEGLGLERDTRSLLGVLYNLTYLFIPKYVQFEK